MPTMKAVRMHQYGGAEVMRVQEVERPTAGTGEVLVRVMAAGVNPIDWKVRAGYLKDTVPLKMPWTPGGDFAGVVEEVGASVSGMKVGDEVYGKADLPRNGSYAEYVVVERTHAAPRPRSIDHVKAAAVPLAAMTAWQAMFGGEGAPSLELAPGQTLLVLGAAGGVGSFAVQMAVARGAKVVAMARRGSDGYLRGIGANEVVDVEGMGEIEKVDAVLDLIGGDVAAKAWGRVKEGGAFASTMGAPSAEEAKTRGVRAVSVFTQTSGSQLEEIGGLIDAGKVRVEVSEVMAMAAVRRAHELLERGGVKGKLVLKLK